jgi:phosphinothricin acetyltransferase
MAVARLSLVEPAGTSRHYRISDASLRPPSTSAGRRRHEEDVMALTVRSMTAGDADAVLRIYQAGLDTELASFETVAPSWEEFDAGRLPAHRFVAVDDRATVQGWVAVSPVSSRCVYAGVVEHSVYVDPAAQGRGAGRLLLRELIGSTEAAGIWTIQSGVFPENTASMRLHERAGFRVIGIRHHIGRVQRPGGSWRDVALLERRSATVYPSGSPTVGNR